MNIADIKDESLKAALRQVKEYCLKHGCADCELDSWCDEVTGNFGICGSMYDREDETKGDL